jgi:hypothetical protein
MLAVAALALLLHGVEAKAGVIYTTGEDPAAFPYTEITRDVVATAAATEFTFAGYHLREQFNLDDVSVTTGGGPNLISNPGFETSDFTGWTTTIVVPGLSLIVGGPGFAHSGLSEAIFGGGSRRFF